MRAREGKHAGRADATYCRMCICAGAGRCDYIAGGKNPQGPSLHSSLPPTLPAVGAVAAKLAALDQCRSADFHAASRARSRPPAAGAIAPSSSTLQVSKSLSRACLEGGSRYVMGSLCPSVRPTSGAHIRTEATTSPREGLPIRGRRRCVLRGAGHYVHTHSHTGNLFNLTHMKWGAKRHRRGMEERRSAHD